MPKITAGGGATNRYEPQSPQVRPGEGVFFQSPPEPAADAASTEPEGDEPSPGTSSSTSLTPSGRTTRRRASKAQSPAPTTEPPSNQPPTEADGGAPTATTSGPETDGETSASPAAD